MMGYAIKTSNSNIGGMQLQNVVPSYNHMLYSQLFSNTQTHTSTYKNVIIYSNNKRS